jgi:hypothetical protein
LLPASGGTRPFPCPPPSWPPPSPPFPARRAMPHWLQTPLNAKLMLAQLHPQTAHMSTKNKRKSQSSLKCLVLHTEISWTPNHSTQETDLGCEMEVRSCSTNLLVSWMQIWMSNQKLVTFPSPIPEL